MHIYTKTGDKGETSLYGGKRVAKSSDGIDAIGNVDELNSVLAIVANELDLIQLRDLSDKVRQIQQEIFMLGSDLATPLDANSALKITRISDIQIKRLEKEIDEWTLIIPELKNFVLPGGAKAALMAYLARAVCRRAERSIIAAQEKSAMNPQVLAYINRLSDWLFTLFRLINHKLEIPEHLWLSEGVH